MLFALSGVFGERRVFVMFAATIICENHLRADPLEEKQVPDGVRRPVDARRMVFRRSTGVHTPDVLWFVLGSFLKSRHSYFGSVFFCCFCVTEGVKIVSVE
jgi:hypothetical protein